MKFKVGDEVIYHAVDESGYSSVEGFDGVVVAIVDESRWPYSVEFVGTYTKVWPCKEEELEYAV